MAKQLNVNLAFTADTGKAKAQLQDLQKQLDQLMTSTSKGGSKLGLTDEVIEATHAAAQLQAQLKAATNVQTGNLDLSKFSSQLKASGTTLDDYSKHFINLGKDGEKAFLNLAKTVATAETPVRNINGQLNEMWTTLKNTARWQISSSVLHGFMGAIQTAYGYAQDLDSSLNNIRIVTGQNVDQMARFAEQANKAAKALSTTTTDYTNASLIYYQQGDTDEAVRQKTDITIKMANAAGESAEKISDQLTAVWNNFDDGTKSLEYYADVMTALGAATASSTDEISEGLEKFAAVADTVGLSYEYATAALATVTAETRQSADVVGTAFKTLFARLQDLELGETLEDGTDLGKYSAAMKKVGIDIKDANGGLKDMDVIIDELGSKWGNLNKDTQIALAQTVAGTRQYTQLVALMDNFDVFQGNLDIAYDSEGELQKQADIYAESWEASADRVRAAWEGILGTLVDKDFFIGLNDGLTTVIEGFDGFLDSIGGLKGALAGVAVVMTTAFGPQLANSINQGIQNFKVFTGAAEDSATRLKNEMSRILESFTGPTGVEPGSSSAFETEVLVDNIQLLEQAREKTKNLSVSQQEYYNNLITTTETLGKMALEAVKASEELNELNHQLINDQKNKIRDNSEGSNVEANLKQFEEIRQAALNAEQTVKKVSESSKDLVSNLSKKTDSIDLLDSLMSNEDEMNNLLDTFLRLKNAVIAFNDALSGSVETSDQVEGAEREMLAAFQDVQATVEGNSIEAYIASLAKTNPNLKLTASSLLALVQAQQQSNDAQTKGEEAMNKYRQEIENLKNTISQAQSAVKSWGQAFTQGMQGLSQFAMGLTSLRGMVDTLNDTDLSFGEKFTRVLTSLTMGLPMVVSGIEKIVKAFSGLEKSQIGVVQSIALTVLGINAETAAQEIQNGATIKGIIQTKLQTIAQNQETASIWGTVTAKLADIAATYGLLAALGLIVAAIAAVTLVAVGLVAAWQAYEKTTLEAKLAAQKKEAEALATAAREAAEEVESIKSAFDGYDSALNTLYSCTQGTDEWTAALEDVNAEIRDILNQYPDLLKMSNLWTTDSQGNRILNQDALAEYQKTQEQNASNLNAASTLSQARVYEAEAAVAEKNLKGQISGALNKQFTSQGGEMDAATAQDVAALRKIIFDNFESLATAVDFEGELSKLVDSADLSAISIAEATSVLAKFEDEIISFQNTSDGAANAISNAEKMLAESELKNSGLSDAAVATASSGLNERAEAIEGNFANANRFMQASTTVFGAPGTEGSMTLQELVEWYAGQGGLSDYQGLADNEIKKDGMIQYTTSEGTEEVNYEVIKSAYAAAKALEEMGASASQAESILSDLGGTDVANSAINDWIASGDLKDLNRENYNTITAEIANTKGGTEEYLRNIFGDNFDKYLEISGKNVDEFVKDFENDLNQVGTIFDNLGNNLTKTVKTAFDEISNNSEFKKMRARQQEQIARQMQSIFNDSGQDALNAYTNIFNSLGGEVDMFDEVVSGIDWNTIDAQGLEDTLNEAGITTNATTGELNAFIDAMAGVGDAVSLQEASKVYNAYQNAASDVAEKGQISDSDYQLLDAGAQEMFEFSANGFWKLKTDVGEFYDYVNEHSLDGFRNNAEIIEAHLARLESATGYSEDDFSRNSASVWSYGGESVQNLDTGLLGAQIAMLQEFATLDETQAGQVQEAATALENGETISTELGALIAQYAADYIANNGFPDLQGAIDNNTAELANNSAAIESGEKVGEPDPTTLGGLQTTMTESAQGQPGESQTDISARINETYARYPEMLQNIASQYNNTADEAAKYERVLASGNEQMAKAAEEELIMATRAGELGEQYDISAEQIEDYADSLKDSGKFTEANGKAMAELAKDQVRYDKAIESCNENMEDWQKTLKKLDGDKMLDPDTASDLADAYGNMFDIDGSQLSDNFLRSAENLDLLKQAANGSEKAYEQLQDKIRQEIAAKIGIDDAEFQTGFDNLLNKYYEGQSLDDIAVGASLDNAGFLQGLTDMVNAAGMTAQEATDYLSSMGVDATVEEETTETQETVGTNLIATPHYTREMPYTVPTQDGGSVEGSTKFPYVTYQTFPVYGDKKTTATALKVTSANKSSGGGVKHSTSSKSGGGGGSSGGGGGGGGGGGSSNPPEKVKKTHKSEVVDRYKEITDKLEDITHELSMQEDLTDKLYGKSKLDAMKKEADLLKDQAEALRLKRDEAEAYVASDKQELSNYAASIGYTVEYDDQGNISNYDEMLSDLYTDLAQAEENKKNAATKEDQDKIQEEQIDPIQDKIDYLKEYIARYDESLATVQEIDEELNAVITTWQENNYEQLTYALELKIEVNDDQLETLDYYLNKVEDDFYKSAEGAQLLYNKAGPLISNLEAQKNYLGFSPEDAVKNEDGTYSINATAVDMDNIDPNSLIGMYGTWDEEMQAFTINEEQMVEGLRQSKEAIIDNLEQLNELDKAMMEYYDETLDAAEEELEKYTSQLEHQTDVLDHYRNITELVGGEQNVEAMNKLLEAQVTMSANKAKASKAWYDELKAQEALIQAQKEEAIANGATEAELAVFDKELSDLQEHLNDAESQMLEDTEAWLEAMRDQMVEKMSQAADELEKALTKDGLGFDYMNEQMDALNARQEEYLTKTNQVYETNKMMRELNTKIDETSNVAAKQRLKNFQKEIEAAQEQNELSNYELEILQAKMDLELAQIALEEAQNAKSQVRLTKDSEGNFSYTYTADQDKVAEAQANFEDAQNNLYNLALDGANRYTEMYVSARQDMYNELTELSSLYYENGEISEEEFQARKEVILNKYLGEDGILTTYSKLYNVAIATDDRAREESWNSSFAEMTKSTEQWETDVNTYLEQCETAHTEFETDVNDALGTVGMSYDTTTGKIVGMDTAVDNLVTANTALTTQITDEIIPKLDEELTRVNEITAAYAAQRDEILRDIAAFEKYLKIIDEMTANAAGEEDQEDIKPQEKAPEEKPTTPSAPEPPPEAEEEKTPEGYDEKTKYGVALATWMGGWNHSGDRWAAYKQKGFDPDEIQGIVNQGYYQVYDKAVKLGVTSWKDYLPSKFDTGGYTGEWGPGGKLALLHEKELVLSKDQTSDFLEALRIQENLAKKTQMLLEEFDNIANSPMSLNPIEQQYQATRMQTILQELDAQTDRIMSGSLGMLNKISSYEPLQSQMENEMMGQQITIYADFPDASDYQEIQMAFDNLINRASQYSYRTTLNSIQNRLV